MHSFCLQRAETVELNNGLEDKIRAAEDHRIAFAVVVGKVQCVGRTLSSRTRNGLGVIRQTQLSEHRSRKTHGIWYIFSCRLELNRCWEWRCFYIYLSYFSIVQDNFKCSIPFLKFHIYI